MVNSETNMFTLLVREDEIEYDLEGRIAYAEYKHKKRLFYKDYKSKNEGKVPSASKIRDWVDAQTYHVDEMRDKAAQTLETYYEARIDGDEDKLIIKTLGTEAGKSLANIRSIRSFFLQVAASVLASIILAAMVWLYLQSQTAT